MKYHTLAAAAALLAASAGTFAANLGTADLSTGSAFFGNTPIAGGFVDTLSFSLTSASFFNGSLTAVVNGTQDVDFTGIVLTGPSGSFSWTMLLNDPVEVWSSSATLAPGTYTLTLTGSNSASMGSYGGNLAVTPVPEPTVAVMLLAGLGVAGIIGMRRRRD